MLLPSYCLPNSIVHQCKLLCLHLSCRLATCCKATNVCLFGRGLFRTSAARWQVPKELAPTGAAPDRATGGVCSPLTPGPHGTLSWSIRLPGRLAPVFLGFKLRVGLDYLASRHGPHFAVPIGMGVGDATTLGECSKLLPALQSLSL